MFSTIPYYKAITVLQVFVTIIAVSCGNSTIDYDLPCIDDSNNYTDYHFRKYTRYGQSKLSPKQFFRSIYSKSYQVLPTPYSKLEYETYLAMFDKSEKKIVPEEILTRSKIFEAYPNEKDERYFYDDPGYYVATDKMYYQSNIYKQEYEETKNYHDSEKDKFRIENPEPLGREEFLEIMTFYELMTKPYEKGRSFIKARVKLGQFLIDNIPGSSYLKIKFHGNYDSNLVKYSSKDVHLKDECYSLYALRMVYLGKVPLHPDICNELYGTHHPQDHLYTYVGLDLKRKPVPRQNSGIEIEEDSDEVH